MEAGAIPYVALLEGRDPVEVLAATPARLATSFAGLSSSPRPANGAYAR
jgi:hypothetical protein